ncbi:MAG: tetratricopeptide repeat protein, partial [Cyclobacteriaceae bacterium]
MKSEDKIPVKAGLFFFFLIAFSYQISFAQSSDTTQAHTYWNSANDYYGQRQYDSASFYYNLSSTAFQEAGYPDKVGHALLRLGNCFYYQGDLPTALKTYLRCIEVYSKAFPEDHLKLASPISGIGGVYVRLGETLKDKEYYKEVYSILVSKHWDNHIKIAPIL